MCSVVIKSFFECVSACFTSLFQAGQALPLLTTPGLMSMWVKLVWFTVLPAGRVWESSNHCMILSVVRTITYPVSLLTLVEAGVRWHHLFLTPVTPSASASASSSSTPMDSSSLSNWDWLCLTHQHRLQVRPVWSGRLTSSQLCQWYQPVGPLGACCAQRHQPVRTVSCTVLMWGKLSKET